MWSRKSFISIISVALCGLMIFASACGRQANVAAPEEEKPFTISIMSVLHTRHQPTDVVLREVERMTNTKLDIRWVPGEIYYEKLNAAMATGSLPMSVSTGSQLFYKELKDAVRHGKFWEIGPHLNKYDNLSRLDEKVMRNTAVDGKLYGLYQERPSSRQGIIYRKDWLDRLGMEPPETVDELFEMLTAFAERDPDGDGQRNTIGLAERNDLVFGAFKTVASYYGTPNNWGIRGGRVEPEFMFPGYMDAMKFMRSLRERGAVNPDFAVTSKIAQRKLFIEGVAGAYIGSLGDAGELAREALKHDPEAKFGLLNRIEGPRGLGVWSIPGYGAAILFPKSAIPTESDLERVLTFYDSLMEPEIYHLLTYGIKDRHYTIVDGRAKIVADPETMEIEVRPLTSLQIGGPSTIDGLKVNGPDELSAHAEQLIDDNERFLIDDPTVGLESKTYDEIGSRLQEIITDATYRYMLGHIDEAAFQDAVEEWRASGGERMIEEFTAQYRFSKP
ncbi:extracellular solute-binding protein [Paenibacillus sp.]|uniref:extracellular solute-binding protein n=1 Tax=Paenibacillus sp. TaxID=58172 RepID=UPI002D63E02D|nr:extracellular solute-binding protein [Paenibacillus sp.]HZG86247.1 extracellular solute-binding protein [Paenibacillus sp.]